MSAETALRQPLGGRVLVLLDRLLAALPLLLPYLTLAIVYGWQASNHGTPWIFTDELEFTQLARSVAETGELSRRGVPLHGGFSLYPYLTAPAWFFDDTKTGYEAAKLIDVLGMTLALFPAYGLARFVVSRPAAILAALGATMIPAYAYTSILVEEPLAYPWATLSLYLAARWYVAPTRRTFAAAAVAAAVAPLFRNELVVLPAILSGVALVVVWQRSRSLRQNWHPAVYAALAAAVAVVGYFAERKETARSVEWRTVTRVFPERLLEYGVWAAGAFTIGIAVLPVVAALVFLVPGRREPRDRGVDALRVVLAFSVLGFGAYTAVKAAYLSTVFADRVSERNLIYLSPLVFAATAAALQRRLIQLWALPVASLAVLYLLTATPYEMDVHFYSDAPGLGILSRANRDYAWTPEHAQTVLLWMLAAATAVLLAVALLRSRPRLSLSIAATAGVLALAWTMTAQLAAASRERSSATSPHLLTGSTARRVGSQRCISGKTSRTRTGSGYTSSGTARSSRSGASTAPLPDQGRPSLRTSRPATALSATPGTTSFSPSGASISSARFSTRRAAGGSTGSSIRSDCARPRPASTPTAGWARRTRPTSSQPATTASRHRAIGAAR